MADGRKLSSDEVWKLEQQIVARYDDVRKVLGRLQGTIDMIEKNWTGQGAASFNQKQTEINDHVAGLGRVLEKFLEGVNLNRKDKDKLEDQLRQDIAQIDVQDLGGKTSALSSY